MTASEMLVDIRGSSDMNPRVADSYKFFFQRQNVNVRKFPKASQVMEKCFDFAYIIFQLSFILSKSSKNTVFIQKVNHF